MIKNVKNNVSWVGKVDWELQKFHGDEYSTHKGSTYNSYLIKEEKTVLIDTVWEPFAKEYVDNLMKEIDLNKIDYIIVNHGEVDHSGALPELMKHIPETPIYCTKKAEKYERLKQMLLAEKSMQYIYSIGTMEINKRRWLSKVIWLQKFAHKQ